MNVVVTVALCLVVGGTAWIASAAATRRLLVSAGLGRREAGSELAPAEAGDLLRLMLEHMPPGPYDLERSSFAETFAGCMRNGVTAEEFLAVMV